MKVPWPVSDREAVVHYFEIEYFKEDLILILVKTISDSEHIDADTHGFSGDGIPQAKDTVRIDLVGGFVLQMVESNRCYFRAIFNFDIKLELIPASLINFISRQLIGNGHKLYQKAVGSVATVDKDYQLALQGPLYVRIRRQVRTGSRAAASPEALEKAKPTFVDEHKFDVSANDNVIKTSTTISEITEEETQQREEDTQPKAEELISSKEEASISPEVEHALNILDQAISMVRGGSTGGKKCAKPSSVRNDFPISELVTKASLFNNGYVPESSNSKSESNMSISIVEEAGRNEAVLSSRKETFLDLDDGSKTTDLKFNCHENLPSRASVRLAQPSTLDSTCKVCDEESLKANGFDNGSVPSGGKTKTKKKRNKLSLGCLHRSFVRD